MKKNIFLIIILIFLIILSCDENESNNEDFIEPDDNDKIITPGPTEIPINFINVYTNICSYQDGYDVHQTLDGGYVTCGENIFGTGCNTFVTKLDPYGNIEWTRPYSVCYDGDNPLYTICILAITQGNSGDIYFTGYKTDYTDYYFSYSLILGCLDKNGNERWIKEYKDEKRGIDIIVDGNEVLVCGYNYDYGFLKKFNDAGNPIWTEHYGGYGKSYDVESVIKTSDEGFLLSGNYKATQYSYEYFIIKTDNEGKTLWEKINNSYEAPYIEHSKAIETKDNNYILGTAVQDDETYFSNLTKYDTEGNILWSKTNYSVMLEDLDETKNGSLIITGHNPKTPIGTPICKLDENGNELWNKIYDYDGNCYSGNAIQATKDNGIIVNGADGYCATGEGPFYDMLVIKTDSNGDI